MRFKKFSVKNYKVFDKTFSVDYATDSSVILTGVDIKSNWLFLTFGEGNLKMIYKILENINTSLELCPIIKK